MKDVMKVRYLDSKQVGIALPKRLADKSEIKVGDYVIITLESPTRYVIEKEN